MSFYDLGMTSHIVDQIDPAFVIHGGAGNVPSRTGEEAAKSRCSLRQAFPARQQALVVSACNTAIAAAMTMEDDPLFNVRRGGVLTANETVETDSAIMTGDGPVGAVVRDRHGHLAAASSISGLIDVNSSGQLVVCHMSASMPVAWPDHDDILTSV